MDLKQRNKVLYFAVTECSTKIQNYFAEDNDNSIFNIILK